MSEKSRGHVVVNTEECKGCGLCVESCPVDVLFLSEKFNTHGYHPVSYKGEGCTGCGVCFYNCPEPGALTVYKRWDLITEVRFCPHCGAEHKVFRDEDQGGILVCTQCLKAIEHNPKIQTLV